MDYSFTTKNKQIFFAKNQVSDWASTHFALDSQKIEFSEALWMVGHFKSI